MVAVVNGKPVVLYLHIPKAGGTTLSDWLFGQLRRSTNVGERSRFFNAGVYYYPAGYVRDGLTDSEESVKTALARDDLRGVLGHFRFGIHEQLAKPSEYITLLRDPVQRVISLYNFQRLVQERWGDLEGVTIPPDMTLEDFVLEPPYPEIDNGQTRRIAGEAAELEKCSDAMLSRAKGHLREHFTIVGTTERFDESVQLLARIFRWDRRLMYYPRNVAGNDNKKPLVPSATVELIENKNSFDRKLYQYAEQLLDEAIADQGDDFDQELERFRHAKRSYFDEVGGWDMPEALR